MPRSWALLLFVAMLPRCGCDPEIDLDALRAALRVDPAEVAFGDTYVGARRERVVKLINAGDAAAPLVSIEVEGDGFSLLPVVASAADPGREVELTVLFAPPTAGRFSGTLTIRADAAEGKELVVPLEGEGVDAPTCQDMGPCVEVRFDPDAGGCVRTELEGACDDDNACTTGGVCVAGECLGEGVDCAAPLVECFVGLCDREDGCIQLPVHESCDDGDPCTEDVCTPTGCTNGPAPDGSLCGELDCAVSSLCFGGTCQQFPTPDGVPCSDGDACTAGDVCTDGECMGVAASGPATIVGRAPVFGAARAVGRPLGDGRIVMRDVGDNNGGVVWTVLNRSSTGVAVESQTAVDADNADDDEPVRFSNAIAPLSSAGFALLHQQGDLEVYSVDGEGVRRRAALDLGQGASGYYRSPLEAVSSAEVASCHDDPDVLLITRAWPAADAAVLQTIDLPSACSDLSWDDKAGRLLVRLASGEVLSATPLSEEPPASLFGGSHAVATNGDLIATAVETEDMFLAGLPREVALLDAASLEEVGRVAPPLGGGAIGYVLDVLLTERWLVVVAADYLSVFDVSDPTAPAPLWANHESAPHNSAPFVLSADDTTLLRSSSLGYWDVVHLFDISGDAPVELSHPLRGGMRRLEVVDGRAYTLHTQSTHIVDLASPTAPAITHGTWRGDRASALVSLGLVGNAPHYGVGAGRNPVVNGLSAIPWRNDADPGASIDLGTVTQPFEPGVVRFESDGRFAYGVRMSNENEAHFDVYDLALFEANSSEPAEASVATLPLGLPGADRNAYAAVSFDAGRAVVVTQHDWDFDTPAAELRSEVLLLDVSAPTAPSVIATATLPGLIAQGRSTGDAVLVVRRTSGGWFNTEHEGEEVLRLVVDEAALRVDASLALDRSADVLTLDEERAVVRTEAGVAFLTHGAEVLALDGELALPMSPTDGKLTPDAVWLVGENGVLSARPPCP